MVRWQLKELNATNVVKMVTLKETVSQKHQFPAFHHPFRMSLNLDLPVPLKKSELKPNKDFESKYNKVKARLALLSPEEVSSDDNEVVEAKVLMALTEEEGGSVSKESAKNGEWVQISMRNHVNTKILKENQNLRKELKELSTTTETWLNSSNKVNQCITEQIPTQKKRTLGVDQLTEDPSNSGQEDLVFEKSSADNIKGSTPDVKRPWLYKAEADESLVSSTPLPPLEKLVGAEPVFGPKTITLILKLNFTFKVEALKGVIIYDPSLAPAKGTKVL
nr:hypothetical protein [Tanacetum cinerariifolium]